VKSIVSFSGEPVSISGKKKEMKVEFRLLCDILAKTISVKAGSFDAITQEKFLMMVAIICGVRINWSRICFNILKDMVTPGTRQDKGYAIQISLLLENVPNLELGESSEFPSSKILTEKTVHQYVVLNDKAEPVVKKKRTNKSNPVSSKAILETLPVEAVPLQMIAPTTAAPTEQPPLPKRKSQKRKRRLVLCSEDEIVDSEAAVGGTSVEQEPSIEHVFEEQQIDDVDDIIQQILTETAQLETDEEIETIDVGTIVGDQHLETFDAADSRTNAAADYFVEEPTEELETVVVEQSADEAMSLQDMFLSIPVECSIPSAGEGSSATDLKILEKISYFHMVVVEDLKEQAMENILKWEKTCCSKIYEGRPRDRGALSARTNTNTRSSCWIRTMLCVDGVWLIEPCADHWVTIPKRVVNNEILRQRSYNDTLPHVSAFFKLMRKRWADVCLELFLDQRPHSSSTSTDSSLHFDDNEIRVEDEVSSPHIPLPAVASNITETLAQIRASVDQIRFEQIRRKDDVDRLRDTLLRHIRELRRTVELKLSVDGFLFQRL
ncbi:hypothetical protein F511_19392, partial [Dorcoceras hygrometricum]